MLYFLLSPLTWGLILVAALCLCWSRLGRKRRIAGMALGGAILILCAPLGANQLVAWAQSQAQAPAACLAAQARPIVLLAGGFERPPQALDDYAALTPASWRRLHGAVQLWRRHPGSTLLISGGGPFPISESAVLGGLARDWGVPESALLLEQASTTTWESAFAVRGLLPKRILLVSTQAHLPRAQIAFQAAGFEPCTQASDSDYRPFDGIGYLLPQATAISKSQAALHELLGRLYYRLRSR